QADRDVTVERPGEDQHPASGLPAELVPGHLVFPADRAQHRPAAARTAAQGMAHEPYSPNPPRSRPRRVWASRSARCCSAWLRPPAAASSALISTTASRSEERRAGED